MPRHQGLKNMPIEKGTTLEELSVSDQLMVELMISGKGFTVTGKELGMTPLQVAKRYERIRKRVLLPTARLLASKLVGKMTDVFFEGINAVTSDGEADTRLRLQTFKTFNEQCDGILGEMLKQEVLKQNPQLRQEIENPEDCISKRTTIVTEELQLRLTEIRKAEENVDLSEYTCQHIDKKLAIGANP